MGTYILLAACLRKFGTIELVFHALALTPAHSFRATYLDFFIPANQIDRQKMVGLRSIIQSTINRPKRVIQRSINHQSRLLNFFSSENRQFLAIINAQNEVEKFFLRKRPFLAIINGRTEVENISSQDDQFERLLMVEIMLKIVISEDDNF